MAETQSSTSFLLGLNSSLILSGVGNLLIAVGLCQVAIAQETNFESEIRPILREYCLDCHGATQEPEAGLDLRLVRFILAGGDSGPGLVPGNAEESLIYQRIVSGDMPPGETRVSSEKIELIKKWIEAGAKVKRAEPEQIGPGIPITEEDLQFWAYRPISPPTLEATLGNAADHAQAADTPIDKLILKAMPEGLSLSAQADRRTLILRLFDDLIGLPPTSAQLTLWLEDRGDDWYERLVEELLASPHYGERWARHWLDAVGYADSDGFTVADADRPWAWRYRDYVIRAFNADKPFDQFIVEQLAGDELAGPADGDWTEQQIELLTATGFLRMAADGTGSGDNSPEARNKTIADTLQIVGSTLLASSLNCAQCHDHRYDPLSHQDYFAIRAVFEPALDWQAWKTPDQRLVSLATSADKQLVAELEQQVAEISAEREKKQAEYMQQALDKELAKFQMPLREQLKQAYETPAETRDQQQKSLLEMYPSVNISPGVLYQYLPDAAEDLKKYDQRIAEVRAKQPAASFLHALVEPPGHAPVTRLFHRGDFNQPQQDVAPASLAVLSPSGTPQLFASDDPHLPTTGRRLALARWLTDSQNPNPLFARAIVNRVWLHHFGRGIVATPGEFGKLGSQPTHPELLDWLADHWIRQGWSLKQLHRQIVHSRVYRQSSTRHATGQAIDPANIFYWHKPLRRMDAEVLRDTILSLSGELQTELFGPPMAIEEDETGQVKIAGSHKRRSVYAKWRRTQPVAMLQTFDAPVMQVNCDARSNSTVAMQSLLMMNNDLVLEQAEKIAKRVKQICAAGGCRDCVTISAAFPEPPESLWRYGTGTLHQESLLLENFQELAHFTGSQWQRGMQLPDAELGWTLLTASGGHPGNRSFPAVRRFKMPEQGQVVIKGQLSRGSEHGDGVRGSISTSGKLWGSWNVQQGQVDTQVTIPDVPAGQWIDVVVDCLEHETSDSFQWPVIITVKALADGSEKTYDSVAQFRGPVESYDQIPEQIITAWHLILQRGPSEIELQTSLDTVRDQLTILHAQPERIPSGSNASNVVLTNVCQVLLGSNEFLYIE